MSLAVEQYIREVLAYSNRPEHEQKEVRAELEDHLFQKAADFEKTGISREDAIYRAIQDHGPARKIGYALRPKFPLIDVRMTGTARGVIAIGQRAVGVFAFGGVACGVFAFGGIAAGLVSMGGLGVALLFCWSGFGLATFCYSGFAVGVVAFGGFALGVLAIGGSAYGLWAEGGNAVSYYDCDTIPAWLLSMKETAQGTTQFFEDYPNFISIFFVAIFVPLLITQSMFLHREKKRLQKAGVKLAEDQ